MYRRQLLNRIGTGFGSLALGSLLAQPGSALGASNPMARRAPHSFGRAKRVVHFFMNGGPSQVDTFDPKPALGKWHGKTLPK
ncbi:MAG: DUF1501 domain-containing protein, partial [Verrucomicrobiota bacterium]